MIAMEFETLGNKTGNLEDVSRPVKTVEVPLICITTSFVNFEEQLPEKNQSANSWPTVSQQTADSQPTDGQQVANCQRSVLTRPKCI